MFIRTSVRNLIARVPHESSGTISARKECGSGISSTSTEPTNTRHSNNVTRTFLHRMWFRSVKTTTRRYTSTMSGSKVSFLRRILSCFASSRRGSGRTLSVSWTVSPGSSTPGSVLKHLDRLHVASLEEQHRRDEQTLENGFVASSLHNATTRDDTLTDSV